MALEIIQKPDKTYHMFPTFKKKTLNGDILETIDNISQEQCNYNCNDINGRCLWNTYSKENGKCTLYGISQQKDSVLGIKSGLNYDRYDGQINISKVPLIDDENIRDNTADIGTCEKLCTNNPLCEAYQFIKPNKCYQIAFDNDPNMSISWKTVIKKSNPTAEEINTINCCTGVGNNCGENVPLSKSCDNKMNDICSRNPYLDACKCIIRNKDLQYIRLKKNLENETGYEWKDECWYPYCIKGKTSSYIPSDMMPTTMTMKDGTELENINCIKKKTICSPDDLYNVNFNEDCKGTTIEGFKQKTDPLYFIIFLGFIIIMLLLIKK